MPAMVRSPGFEPGSSAWQAGRIDYRELREDFIEFLKSRNLNRRYIHCIISYLDEYVKVIPANLTAGDSIYITGYRNVTIASETTGTYAGACRAKKRKFIGYS